MCTTKPYWALMDVYLNGTLDEAGWRTLEGYLRSDPAAIEDFVRYCRLHTDLYLKARAGQAGKHQPGVFP